MKDCLLTYFGGAAAGRGKLPITRFIPGAWSLGCQGMATIRPFDIARQVASEHMSPISRSGLPLMERILHPAFSITGQARFTDSVARIKALREPEIPHHLILGRFFL